ncbi:sensor histidine kinase [Geotalea toluenoxydans]
MAYSSGGTDGGKNEQVILLLAESRDAGSIPLVLDRVGVSSVVCATAEEIGSEIDRGVGALLMEEEMLSPSIKECLVRTLDHQPPWSELPIIVLLRPGPETEVSRDALFLPGDVTLVERPVRVNTLVAIVRSALRSRRRQYLMRDQLRALEESETRYRTLFDSMDEGFCIIEVVFDGNEKPTDYRFLVTNPAFEKQTSLSNVQGKRVRELLPELEEHWFEIYCRVALTGEPARFQRRAEQLQRWYDVYAFRFKQPEKRQVAILFNDITESKRAEEERERLVADLEHSNRELQQFAHAASHDLQEPLRMVSSYMQLLQRKYGGKLDETADTYIHYAVDGTRRMQSLIEGLLKYSRIGRADFAWVDTNKSFADATANLATAIEESQAEVTSTRLPTIWGDATQMLQLMQNLISNGLKYRKPDVHPHVFVTAELGAQEWLFSVRDNGIGIKQEDFDKIFQIFQRLHTQEEYSGTGIGLASCKKIIEQHQGRIWLESTPGEGTTFFFTIPQKI